MNYGCRSSIPSQFGSEIGRTKPDFLVYVPSSIDGSKHDTGNEHFMVFKAPDGTLMSVWTQSTREGCPDQHIVFSKSPRGRKWTKPVTIAGADADPKTGKGMASWGFPMVSKSGRIYVLYNLHTGINDVFTHTTGLMAARFSDDLGDTWSKEQEIPMPRSCWDNPDTDVPANWIVWQRPHRVSNGKYLAGFTRWISPRVRPRDPMDIWWAKASVVEFMRFENLDSDPDPGDLDISYHMSGKKALKVPLEGHPDVSVVQEPSIVVLPDGRLFSIMRTTRGSPYYSVSEDGGRRWSNPKPLLYHDQGPPVMHPVSPCPIYTIGDGRYALLYHNHDGHFGPWGPRDTTRNRRPVYVSRGCFCDGAEQPIRFSGPRFLMDNDGVPIGYGDGRCDLAMYSSFTWVDEKPVLWYPDRKFFLLGKILPERWLSEGE